MAAYSSGDDVEPLPVEGGGRPPGTPRRTLVVAGLLAVVLVTATLGVRFGQASSNDRGGVVTTECSGELVLLHEDNLPLRPLQIYADLRGGGDASLPVTTDQVLVATGSPSGHQSFRPTAGGLTVSFRLPPSASMSAEIQDEHGTVLRRTQLAPLVRCESR